MLYLVQPMVMIIVELVLKFVKFLDVQLRVLIKPLLTPVGCYWKYLVQHWSMLFMQNHLSLFIMMVVFIVCMIRMIRMIRVRKFQNFI